MSDRTLKNRVVIFLVMAMVLLVGTVAIGDWKFNPHTGKLDYYEASGTGATGPMGATGPTGATGPISGSGTLYHVAVWSATEALGSVTPSTAGYVLTSNGTSATPSFQAASGSMTYPGAGFAVSTGAAWDTSFAVGTMTNNKACRYATASNTISCNSNTPTYFGTPTLNQWAYWGDTQQIAGVTLAGSKVACTSVSGIPTACTNLTDSVFAPLASPTFTGTVTIPSSFTLGATSVTTTGTELNYVGGVTSSIQTQLNSLSTSKASIAGPTLTGAVTVGDNTGLVQVKGFIPTSTGTWSGLAIPITCGAAASAPKAVYLMANGKASGALATATSTMPAVCLLVEDCGAVDQVKMCMTNGLYYFASSPGYSTSSGTLRVINVATAAAGVTTTSQPSTSGQYVQRIGIGLAADKGYFDFNKTMVKVP